MNTSTRPDFWNNTTAFSWLLVGVMSCLLAAPSRAADPSAEAQEPVAIAQVTIDQSMAVDNARCGRPQGCFAPQLGF